MTRNKLNRFIQSVKNTRESADDDFALDHAAGLYKEWKAETEYTENERIQYKTKLYRCVQSHTSQENWKPSTTPALWTEVAKQGEIPVWRQPTGAQDAYMIGDKVWYPEKNTIKYISIVDNNTWKPDVYGWNIIE